MHAHNNQHYKELGTLDICRDHVVFFGFQSLFILQIIDFNVEIPVRIILF